MLSYAIERGNLVHDTYFHGQGVNLGVMQALQMLQQSVAVRAVTSANVKLSKPAGMEIDESLLLEAQLAEKANSGGRKATVIVGDNGMSFCVLWQDEHVLLVDSHCYGEQGSLLAVGTPKDVVAVMTTFKVF